jgi:predicted ATPase
MELLEREHFLGTLQEYARDAAAGSRRFVLIAGEVGVGKTALPEQFRADRPDLRWWWSACDGSFTPRPLGPLYEIAVAAGGRLLELCTGETDRRELFAQFLADLQAGDRPTVVVVEDLHWADDATLDWLRHLARRIARTPALLLITYRDDEPATASVLRPVVGQVATHRGARRMFLPPLSPQAVRRLAGDRAADAEELHRLTGGVPFYVREVLSVSDGEVPRTVSDIVAARTAHLPGPARRLIGAAAVTALAGSLPVAVLPGRGQLARRCRGARPAGRRAAVLRTRVGLCHLCGRRG